MRRRGGEDPEQIVPHVPRRLLAPVVGRPDSSIVRWIETVVVGVVVYRETDSPAT